MSVDSEINNEVIFILNGNLQGQRLFLLDLKLHSGRADMLLCSEKAHIVTYMYLNDQIGLQVYRGRFISDWRWKTWYIMYCRYVLNMSAKIETAAWTQHVIAG